MVHIGNAVKSFFAILFCGMSTIQLFPSADYGKQIPQNAQMITRQSWRYTGEALYQAIQKTGKAYGLGSKQL